MPVAGRCGACNAAVDIAATQYTRDGVVMCSQACAVSDHWYLCSPEHLTALTEYARRHGRYWKQPLHDAWMNGIYDADKDLLPWLQQIRNQYGPSWLVRFRFPKE